MLARTQGFRCFECAEPAQYSHHVVPYVLGGTRTIPLCAKCHSKIHDKDFTLHTNLIKVGLHKARASGVKLGRPRKYVPTEIHLLPNEGQREAARRLGMSRATLQRYWHELHETNAS